MERGKDLSDEEKSVIIRKSTKDTSIQTDADMLGRHVHTVRQFLRDPSPKKKWSYSGVPRTLPATDLKNISWNLRKNPEQTIEAFFTGAGIPDVLKIIRCLILETITYMRAPLKLFALIARNGNLWLE